MGVVVGPPRNAMADSVEKEVNIKRKREKEKKANKTERDWIVHIPKRNFYRR